MTITRRRIWTGAVGGAAALLAGAALLVGTAGADDRPAAQARPVAGSPASPSPDAPAEGKGSGATSAPGAAPAQAPSRPATTEGAAGQADPSRPPVAGGNPPVDPGVPAERALYCELEVVQVRNLLAAAGEDGDTSAALRDAVPLLQDRLTELRSGAEGLAGSEEQLELLESVQDRWQEALTAYDMGDPDVADRAMAAAEEDLQAFEAFRGRSGTGCEEG